MLSNGFYQHDFNMPPSGRYATSDEIERLIRYFSRIREADLRAVILNTLQAIAETKPERIKAPG